MLTPVVSRSQRAVEEVAEKLSTHRYRDAFNLGLDLLIQRPGDERIIGLLEQSAAQALRERDSELWNEWRMVRSAYNEVFEAHNVDVLREQPRTAQEKVVHERWLAIWFRVHLAD